MKILIIAADLSRTWSREKLGDLFETVGQIYGVYENGRLIVAVPTYQQAAGIISPAQLAA